MNNLELIPVSTDLFNGHKPTMFGVNGTPMIPKDEIADMCGGDPKLMKDYVDKLCRDSTSLFEGRFYILEGEELIWAKDSAAKAFKCKFSFASRIMLVDRALGCALIGKYGTGKDSFLLQLQMGIVYDAALSGQLEQTGLDLTIAEAKKLLADDCPVWMDDYEILDDKTSNWAMFSNPDVEVLHIIRLARAMGRTGRLLLSKPKPQRKTKEKHIHKFCGHCGSRFLTTQRTGYCSPECRQKKNREWKEA